ncbi:5564_t:CDS:2 [Entrophospora sp. SA101]|nr:5564_t:CDS:2 [Entrophospora sp. SA101]
MYLHELSHLISHVLSQNSSQKENRRTSIKRLRTEPSLAIKNITNTIPTSITTGILEICDELLTTDTLATKRSIYYRDVNLFGNPERVDRAIDDLCRVFQVTRKSLNLAKSYENHNLAIQNFHWIGLHYKDIKDYHIPDNILIEMTINDEKKCKDLLKNNNLPSSWRTELRKLSKLKKKAEIESLSHKDNNGLLDYFISRVNDERSWL